MKNIDVGTLTEEQTAELLKECLRNLDISVVCKAVIATLDAADREELLAQLEDAET
ncbi:MAG TPA: hypothetical protein VFB71_12300 [Ramlibacter sp.]|nr:hypothetical protein [Ramlibacter sp.]